MSARARAARAAAPSARAAEALAVRQTDDGAAAIYRRELLGAGATFAGPAVVESDDATICVPPRAEARVDEHGNLRVRV